MVMETWFPKINRHRFRINNPRSTNRSRNSYNRAANKDNETPTDYESMTVVQLKELLKSAGKPVSGKKADLISRLLE